MQSVHAFMGILPKSHMVDHCFQCQMRILFSSEGLCQLILWVSAGLDKFTLPPGTFVTEIAGEYASSAEQVAKNISGNCTAFVQLNHANHYGICDFNPSNPHQVSAPDWPECQNGHDHCCFKSAARSKPVRQTAVQRGHDTCLCFWQWTRLQSTRSA